MRVLFLFPRFGLGGIANALSFVARSVDEAGMDVVCVSMSSEHEMVKLPKKAKRIYLEYCERGTRLDLVRSKLLFLPAFRSVIRQEKPDVIVAFGVDIARIVVISAFGLKKKVIASERGNPFIYTKRQANKYIRALNRCTFIVCQTETVARHYRNLLHRPIYIIPNPCSGRVTGYNTLSSSKKKVILVFSRLSEEKNVEGVIDAFNIAKNKLKNAYVEAELRIYGSGEKKADLEQKIIAENISGVIIKDGVRNVLEIEKCVDAFILNSDYDGFPNALIEAMEVGIPCIATDCPPGGVKYITDSGKRAVLVRVRDNNELANAIVKVLTDKRFASELADNGKKIREILDPEIIGNEWVKLISDACN